MICGEPRRPDVQLWPVASLRCQTGAERLKTRPCAGIKTGRDFSGACALAIVLMRHGEEFHRQSAGVMCTARFTRCLETLLGRPHGDRGHPDKPG